MLRTQVNIEELKEKVPMIIFTLDVAEALVLIFEEWDSLSLPLQWLSRINCFPRLPAAPLKVALVISSVLHPPIPIEPGGGFTSSSHVFCGPID